MRTLALLVRKDLLRLARAPLAVLIMLLFPVVFSLLIGLTFGTGDVEPPQVRLLIEDLDQTFVSGLLTGAFESDQAGKYFDTTAVGPEGLKLIERGKASALLRIPEGFAEDLLEGNPITLQLVRNPAESILPEVAEQTMIVLAEGLDAASRLLREPLDEMSPWLQQEDPEIGATDVAAISVAFYDAIEGFETYLLPPVIVLESLQLDETPLEGEDAAASSTSSSGAGTFSIFLMMLPGVSVYALFMLGDMSMRDILTESTTGTLRRQLSGPLPAWMLVAGKAAYAATVALAGLVTLTLIGLLALDHPVSFPAFAALSAAVILAVTGFGALIYGVARTAGQGATLSSILLLVFAFMGGSFLPLNSLPAALRQVAPASPFYWATTGFQRLLQPGSAEEIFGDILPNLAVLTGLGGSLLVVGALLLGRRVRRGGAA